MSVEPQFVLTFHGLGEPRREIAPGEDEYWLSPEFFNQVLDLVTGRSDAQITFDDANASDIQIALPALKRRGLRGTFFLVSSRLDEPGFLQRDEALALRDAGMEIGSHGVNHRKWGHLRGVELRSELRESRESLEQILGQPIRDAAAPFGSYNRRVVRDARREGYSAMFTSDNGPASAGSFVRPRNTIMRRHTLADVERAITEIPGGLPRIVRSLKLFIKRWR